MKKLEHGLTKPGIRWAANHWVTSDKFSAKCLDYTQNKDTVYFDYTLSGIYNDIDSKIVLSEKLPVNDSIALLRYLSHLIENFIKKFCLGFGYDVEYVPSKEQIQQEIEDNIDIYLECGVSAGDIIYCEESDSYTDYTLLDAISSDDYVSPYIHSDDKEGLAYTYYEYFENPAATSIIENYANEHEFASSVERYLKEKIFNIGLLINHIKSTHEFMSEAIKFNNPTQKIYFYDYLTCENAESFSNRVGTLINGYKGRRLAVFLKALYEMKFVNPGEPLSEIFSSMKRSFGDIGTYEGVAKYFNDRNIQITAICQKEVSEMVSAINSCI